MQLVKNLGTEKFITKFAKIYTPIVVVIAVLIILIPTIILNQDFNEYLRRALIFLVVSCPCALVLSIPLGYFCGIGASSKKGILIKGSNYLDELNKIDTILFDKTGTLTKGVFKVVTSKSVSNLTEDEVFEYIAISESFSNHYIAKSIIGSYRGEVKQERVEKHEEIAGYGIKAVIDNKDVLVVNYRLLDENNIQYAKPLEAGTIVHLAINKEYKGYIVLADELKEDSIATIKKLKNIGIKRLEVLTGDSKELAEEIAKKLNVDKVYSELLPEDKVNILEKLKSERAGKIAYIGDGINDSPVIAMADIGMSMGKGADLAIESSDIVLMTDEPAKLVETIKIAKRTRKIVLQNIIFAISVKLIFLILSGVGITTMWEAVFADVGVSFLAVLNSLRIMK